MVLQFYKYQGAGNDFIMLDDRQQVFDTDNYTLIEQMCNRHVGIGADGLILLRKDTNGVLQMVYFNADGKEGTLCGNGARCFTAFALDLGLLQESATFLASDGLHEVHSKGNGIFSLAFHVPHIISASSDVYEIDTGSPHYVTWVDELSIDVNKEGRRIRNSDKYRAKGINVNFVKKDGDMLYIKTYERGVENETLACGTGIVAAAIASYHSGRLLHSPVQVQALGGKLEVSFEHGADGYTNVWLTGPAIKVFDGNYALP